jgi:hypothetical protein
MNRGIIGLFFLGVKGKDEGQRSAFSCQQSSHKLEGSRHGETSTNALQRGTEGKYRRTAIAKMNVEYSTSNIE